MFLKQVGHLYQIVLFRYYLQLLDHLYLEYMFLLLHL